MGHRITRAAWHLSVDEVKERMRTEARPWVRHHWWIIYNALVAPRKAEELALHRVIAAYNRLGPGAIEQSERGGRYHQYLTHEQEQALLQSFSPALNEARLPRQRKSSKPCLPPSKIAELLLLSRFLCPDGFLQYGVALSLVAK